MKPLLVLARITFVGCLWSIIFIEGIRVIVLENWRFDIFWPPHWVYAWDLWQSGWIIDTRKEWAFVLILLTFIPLWLMGWIVLSLVPWETILYRIICFPFRLFKKSVTPLAHVVNPTPVITKKKSYKEVRPVGKRMPIYEYNTSTPSAVPAVQNEASVPAPITNPTKERAVTSRETLNHTIFDLDDETDDFDLDIDSFDKSDIFKIDSKKKEQPRFERESEERQPKRQSRSRQSDFEFDDYSDDNEDYRPRPKKNEKMQKHVRYSMEDEDDEDLEAYEPSYVPAKSKRRPSDRFESDEPRYEKQSRHSRNEQTERGHRNANPVKSSGGAVGDVLQEKGYDVIRNVKIGKNTADYLAISSDKILVCIVDKEQGDWLADEERFNDEEPLWFSENAHRISPVRKADLAAGKLQGVLEDEGVDLDIKPLVVVTSANIINAEDMIDVWKDLDVDVARFGKGGPTDLEPFARVVKTANDNLSSEELGKLKKILQKLA